KSSGQFSWTASSVDAGHNYPIRVRASDGKGGDTDQVFNLSVTSAQPNRAPVFQSLPILTGKNGKSYAYQSEVTDPDFDLISYSVTCSAAYAQAKGLNPNSKPAWITVNSSGLLSGTPTQADLDLKPELSLKASDGKTTTEQIFSIYDAALSSKPNSP